VTIALIAHLLSFVKFDGAVLTLEDDCAVRARLLVALATVIMNDIAFAAINALLDAGYEGIIIRLDGHPYYHGRSQNVFKMKPETEVI